VTSGLTWVAGWNPSFSTGVRANPLPRLGATPVSAHDSGTEWLQGEGLSIVGFTAAPVFRQRPSPARNRANPSRKLCCNSEMSVP
jgi:hypothetical protein